MPDDEWIMYAGRNIISNDVIYTHIFPEIWYPAANDESDIVEVLVKVISEDKIESAKTKVYWGWLASDKNYPCMIWCRYTLFSMCFTYGPQVEEEHGKGKILRLTITETEE